jgi:Protein of unknown function (DUF3040)
MINERDRRILEALEQRTFREDPGFARRLGGGGSPGRWSSAGRRATSVPVLVLAAALAIMAFVLNLGALGLLFLGWALVGSAVRIDRHVRRTRECEGDRSSGNGVDPPSTAAL